MNKLLLTLLIFNASCLSEQRVENLRTPIPKGGSNQVINTGDSHGFSYVLNLSEYQKQKIAEQIFKNETGGSRAKLVHWNVGEEFPSLGIAHFIWIRSDQKLAFSDSFKGLIEFYISGGYRLPKFLNDLSPSFERPWRTSSEFWSQRNSSEVMELEKFLAFTFNVQASYVFEKMKNSLPKIFNGLSDRNKDLVDYNIKKVITSSASWYPIVDYINFKGAGTDQIETTASGGWGLRQVLLKMNSKDGDASSAFAEAAKNILSLRIQKRPQDERWREGWYKRIDTYKIFDIESDSGSFKPE